MTRRTMPNTLLCDDEFTGIVVVAPQVRGIYLLDTPTASVLLKCLIKSFASLFDT